MPLQFPCPQCGHTVALRFLNIGEVAKCKSCGQSTQVPESAELISSEEYVRIADQVAFGESSADPLSIQDVTSSIQPESIYQESARYVRGLLFAAGIMLFLINGIFWTSSGNVNVLGKEIFFVGRQAYEVRLPDGWVLVKNQKTLHEWDTDKAIFIVHGDSLHDEYPVVFAEATRMEGLTTAKMLRENLLSDTTMTIVSNRIIGDQFELISVFEEGTDDMYYFYIRYIPSYPYYLTLYAAYYGESEPPEELRNLIRNVDKVGR